MSDGVEDIEIHLLLEALYRRYHYDFRHYALASIKRRLKQARQQLGFHSFSALQDAVLHDPAMLPRLLDYLTVQVSEMFRDPSYFRAIREKVVPHLRTYPSLKVWIAGCSSGEELHSFAILFREEGLLDRTLIYATDINPGALEAAASGVYALDHIKAFTENHQKSGGSRLSPTTTPPPTAALCSTSPCAAGWSSPITVWSPTRSSPRFSLSLVATC